MIIARLIVFLLLMFGEFIIVGIMLIEYPIRQAIKTEDEKKNLAHSIMEWAKFYLCR